MPNSAYRTGFFGGGGTIKAWGVFAIDPGAQATSYKMTVNNMINGYNLNFDDPQYSAKILRDTDFSTLSIHQQEISMGAIPFKFVTPMKTKNYKVFAHPRAYGIGYDDNRIPGRAYFAHCLNSTQYPKTTDGFWVRFGILLSSANNPLGGGSDNDYNSVITQSPGLGRILNRTLAIITYQMQVVVV
jgi:hypothetical protein